MIIGSEREMEAEPNKEAEEKETKKRRMEGER